MALDIRQCESKSETSNDINIMHVWSSKNPTKQRHKIYRKDQVVDFYNKNGGRVLKKKKMYAVKESCINLLAWLKY